MKLLLSAYACEPGRGSEPGVGWNTAVHLAQRHEVWVFTRANNRAVIEAELARHSLPNLHLVYHDLPSWARFWKRGLRGVQAYYYLGQLTAVPLVRKLHREIGFDILHRVTFVKYWAPSALAFVEGPSFIWKPVGGGESAPFAFWFTLGVRGVLYEGMRTLARTFAEQEPLVRFTARRAALALATTPETAARLKPLGAQRVDVLSQVTLSNAELRALTELPPPPSTPPRFLNLGRLLAWKGFHLGLQAFARSGLQAAEFWIVRDGPERRRLEAPARQLGIADRVRFWGALPRPEVLRLLGQVHALVHPSLHDSGGWVCIEAMAAGRPVLFLELGRLVTQATQETAFLRWTHSPVIKWWGIWQKQWCKLPPIRELYLQMGNAVKSRVHKAFHWKVRIEQTSMNHTAIV